MDQKQQYLVALEAIKNKLKGRELHYREIYAIMDQIGSERLGDVLTTYFAAAGFSEGFSPEELYYLTKAMVETGEQLEFPGIVADKHSIGGVAGTRATMIIVPIIIAAGFTIPKTSSCAITSPAGTADVMGVLAKVNFTTEQVQKIVYDVGGCIIWGGHLGLAPADDVIIRVEEPLSFESFDKIIVSIMAKKIAVSTNHLVIDMPIGKTMKIKYKKDAVTVKRKFEKIADKFGIKIIVDINTTHEPAGFGIGPALEAIDVMKVLEQDESRPHQLEKRSIRLAGMLLDLCYKTTKEKEDGAKEARLLLKNGKALNAFRNIIKAQYGNPHVTWKSIETARHKKNLFPDKSGTIMSVNNYHLNAIAKILGAPNDHKAGIKLHVKRKDYMTAKRPLMTFHSSSEQRLSEALDTIESFPIFTIE